MERSS